MEIEVLCFGDPDQARCRETAAWVERTWGGQAVVRHVDVWAQPDLARSRGIVAVPAVVVVGDGQELARFSGPPRGRALRRALRHIETALAA